MPTSFDNASTHERALQVWQILIGKAHNRQTMTYSELASLLGYSDARPIHHFLNPIMRYCDQNALPPLTVLVVQKGSGSPGEGLTTTVDAAADRQRVFAYNWYNLHPPTPDELKAALD